MHTASLLSRLTLLVLLYGLFCLGLQAQDGTVSNPQDPDAMFAAAGDSFRLGRYDVAMSLYQSAGTLYAAADQQLQHCQALIREGECRLLMQTDEAALNHLLRTERLVAAQLGTGHEAYSDVEFVLGRYMVRNGDFPAAEGHFRAALDIRSRLLQAPDEKIAECYKNIGISLAYRGELSEAMRYHQMNLDMAHQLDEPNPQYLTKSYTAMGQARTRMGQLSEAEWAYDRALDWARKAHEGRPHPDIARIYMALGNLADAKGNFTQGLERYELALEQYKAARAPLQRQHICLLQMANDYQKMGDYLWAEEYDRRALALLQDIYDNEENWSYAASHLSLGNALLLQKRAAEALDEYKEVLCIREAIGQIETQLGAETYYDIGLAYDQLGDSLSASLAVAHYAEAIRIAQQLGDADEVTAISKAAWAENNYRRGLHEEALLKYAEASALLEGQLIYAPRYAEVCVGQARTLEAMGRPQEALAVIHRGMDAIVRGRGEAGQIPMDQVLNHRHLLDLLASKARLLAQIGTDEALAEGFRLYDEIDRVEEHMRQHYVRDVSKMMLNEDLIPVYEKGIEIALELYRRTGEEAYFEAALGFCEANKASLLLESLMEVEARKFGGIPDSLLRREQQLKSEIAWTRQQMLADSEEAAREQYAARHFQLLGDCDKLRNRLESDFPAYYQLKYEREHVGLEQIRDKVLAADEVLLEFFVGDEHVFVLAVSRDQLAMHQWERNHDTDLLIRNFRGYTSRFTGQLNHFQGYCQVGHQLYLQILEPLKSVIRDRKLLLVPDGPLGYISFEALLTAPFESERADYHALPYLLHQHAVRYDYSAAMALRNALAPLAEGGPAAYLGMAPAFGERLTPLREAQNCVRILGDRYEGGLFFAGSAATKSRFQAAAPQAGILHLATHGFINDEDPMLSQLMFSHAEDSTLTDSLLTYELYAMHLRAELAILSACNTGSGKLMRGEGVMSMARGFSFAGCPSVVMSLWEVGDNAYTTAIMEHFLAGLAAGLRKEEALRQAKLNFLEELDQPVYAHPAIWSELVLIGNPRPLQLEAKPGFPWWYLALGLGVCLGGVGWWGWRQRGRKSG